MKKFFTLALLLVSCISYAQEPATKTEKPTPPMVVIDGIKYLRSDPTDALKNLDPIKVNQVKVLREKEAIELYGEEGKFGVVVVTTKDGLNNKPLFLLDGNRVEDLSAIDPNSIQSIEIIKDSVRLQPYGIEGKLGVVKITSKPKY
jgi:bla regulator protein blaR1